MEFKFEDTSIQIKIVLMGEPEQKQQFIKACQMNALIIGEDRALGIDFIPLYMDSGKVTFDIYDTAGQERSRAVTPSFLKNCKAIIFFGEADQFKKCNEKIIQDNQICTFDFDSYNLQPIEFLTKLEDFFLTDPAPIVERTLLVKEAYKSKDSVFKILPIEVSSYITLLMHNKHCFFSNKMPINLGIPQLQAPKKGLQEAEEGIFSKFMSLFK